MTQKQKTAREKTTPPEGFTAEERAAMKERSHELKSARSKADPEQAVLEKIAELSGTDRELGERLHALVREVAPTLSPKLWYGMPAYARDGKVVCFFQAADKFKSRYATLGFSDLADLDEGVLWPTAYALTAWNPDVEATVAALVKKAVGRA